jgi:hypothetical protein
MIKSRRMILEWHIARIVEKSSAYRVLVARPEGKRPLGRLRSRLEVCIACVYISIGTNGGLS